MSRWAFIGLIVWTFTINAQQIPLYNHDFVNPYALNPAYAGYQPDMKAFLIRNSRNSEYNGGSINNYLTVDGGLVNGKFGFGLSVFYQTHGLLKQSGGNASYAYHLKIKDQHRLSFGLSLGVLDNKIDVNGVNVMDVNDPYLLGLRQDKLIFNSSVGLVYQFKKTRIGISVPQVIGNKVKYANSNSAGYYQLARHYMLNATHEFLVHEKMNMTLSPFATFRYMPGAILQYEGMMKLDIQKLGWLAVGYKSDYAVQFNIGFRVLKSLQIGYSYELVVGSMKRYQTGVNHEFMLGYSFGGNEKERKRIEELEKEQLSLENQLKKKLAEQKELEKQNELALQKNKQLEDSLKNLQVYKATKPADKDTLPNDYFRNGAGYQMVDLYDFDSPSGYYVVTGVFSKRENADQQVNRCVEKGFEKTFLVVNKKNHYYYVVILLTQEKQESIDVLMNYRNLGGNSKSWILDYYQVND